MDNVNVVAKYIINYCYSKKLPISNLKLQKLLYFVQAQFLVKKDYPCFPEEIEAWDFGPVVPEIYRIYKKYGSSNLPKSQDFILESVSENDRILINSIIDKCALYSATQLVTITHNQTPWLRAYQPYQSNIITKQSIKDYFSD